MTIRKKAYFRIFLVSCLALLTACAGKNGGAAGDDKPTVVVTIPPLAYFANEIGGDRVEVECLTTETSDPETFEPSMQQLRKASGAKILLTVGLLPFEQKITESVSSTNPDVAILILSDSIDLIHDTHGEGEMDPHIWNSLRNAKVMARQTCTALTKAMPQDSTYFQTNLVKLVARLDSIDTNLTQRLTPLRGTAFVVEHPSLSYFARDYGLRQLAIGHENKESSIVGLKSRLDEIKQDAPVVMFYSSGVDERQVQTITATLNLPAQKVQPLSAQIDSTIAVAGETIITNSQRQK
jgi:zinc transport system substrate-binding protein